MTNEDIKIAYERIVNGYTVYLSSGDVSELEDYAFNKNDEKLLNNMIQEHNGDNVYKCFLYL